MPETDVRLSPKQVAFYHHDGFVTVDRLISPAEIADLQQMTDQFVEQSRAVTAHTDLFDLEPGHTPESPRLRRLKAPPRSSAARSPGTKAGPSTRTPTTIFWLSALPSTT